MRVAGIVAAAGQGKRMGGGINKQFMLLGGRPLLFRTLEAFCSYPFAEVVVCLAPGEEGCALEQVLKPGGWEEGIRLVTGGQERQDSIYNALVSLDPGNDLVAIHDGARPFLTEGLLREVIGAAAGCGAAVAGVPVKDTIKVVDRGEHVVDTPSRELLWAAQTPQAFRYGLILEAYKRALGQGYRATDDASLVERMGEKVKVVRGSYRNIKITTREDYELAGHWWREEGLSR